MKASNKQNSTESVATMPEGFHTVTPFLVVKNAQGLLDFITKAFDGAVEFVMKLDDGTISHSTVRIGDSKLMIADKMKDTQVIKAMLYLYLDDVDSIYERALNIKGSKAVREPRDEFYGDRSACIEDEWGNQWWIATHIEDVSNDELSRRKSAVSGKA